MRTGKLEQQPNADCDIRFLRARLQAFLYCFPLYIPRYKFLVKAKYLYKNWHKPARLRLLVFKVQVFFLTPMILATPIEMNTAPKENRAPIFAAS